MAFGWLEGLFNKSKRRPRLDPRPDVSCANCDKTFRALSSWEDKCPECCFYLNKRLNETHRRLWELDLSDDTKGVA